MSGYTKKIEYKDVMLISPSTVKQVTGIDNNIEDDLIESAIMVAQDIFLQARIGTNIIQELQRQVYENTLTTDYKYLLDNYITQPLAFNVAGDLMLPQSFKLKQKGVVQQSDEKIITVGLRDIQVIMEYYENKAEFYVQRLIDFLISNNPIYPQFLVARDCSDMIGKASGYQTGCNIFLKGDEKRNPDYWFNKNPNKQINL